MSSVLIVRVPATRLPEHTWVVKTILSTYLGLDVCIVSHEFPTVIVTDTHESREMQLPSVLLAEHPENWSTATAVPDKIAYWIDPGTLPWTLREPPVAIPILYTHGIPHQVEITETRIAVGWDLFGSAFFMLARLEEVLIADSDSHGRFPAKRSLAVRAGFDRIPVVNLWAELLWQGIKQLWPGLERMNRDYRVLVSHDVDWPLVANQVPLRSVLKSAAGDVIIRKSPGVASRRLLGKYAPEALRPKLDPGNTFEFIMKESEIRGLTSAFFFIPQNTAGSIDGTYSLEAPFLQDTLRRINQRGHEIGIHPGYCTYQSSTRIQSGFDHLRQTTESLGIRQSKWGGRQHYLRWSASETWRHWDSAGLNYDSSIGYAETVGFRSGACFEYPAFDVLQRRELRLSERPLILMEGSLFAATSPHNLALSDEDGLNIVYQLAQIVKAHRGDFTLLWHNSSLITERQKNLYLETLLAVCG